MTRNLTAATVLALLGAAVIAAPASAQTIRITTVGKSTAQLSQEIRAAAREVCWTAYTAMPTPLSAYSACVDGQVKSAKAQLKGASLAQLSTDNLLR
jgi:hypothetical protein